MGEPGIPPPKSVTDFLPDGLPRDCTLFLHTQQAKEFLEYLEGVCQPDLPRPGEPHQFSWATAVRANGNNVRLQVTRCYQGRLLSVTIRDGGDQKLSGVGDKTGKPGFAPSSRAMPEFVNSVEDISRAIYGFISQGLEEKRSGLLVISGATNAGKSQVARGLTHMYSQAEMHRWQLNLIPRKPHVVTYEDTLDKEMVDPANLQTWRTTSGLTWLWTPVEPDYTPRVLGMDVRDLEQGIRDALRQTPAIYYIAETRDEADWQSIMHLAESHVVITTAHAANLLSTFSLLRRALKIETPQRRGELAQNILGVVNLWGGAIQCGPQFVLPSMWRRTPQSVKSFAADGLASIVPMFREFQEEKFKDDVKASSYYSPGRRAFCSILASSSTGHRVSEDHLKSVARKAIQLDLRGE